MIFKKLYKQTSSGAIQEWHISVDENNVITNFGQLKSPNIQTTSEKVFGKNIGKINETSDNQQALLRAQQMYEAKLKKGYTSDLELAKKSNNVLDGIEPMLAFPIEKKEKYVVFPAFAQPKLDGMRCLAVVRNGKCTLFTRTQRVISTLPHVNDQLEFISKTFGDLDFIMDGELYNHNLKHDFNRLMSLIKRDEPHEDCKDVEFHVYDLVSNSAYIDRMSKIQDLLSTLSATHIVNVMTHEVYNREDLNNLFHCFLKQGYEGAMYRNPNIPYENKRSVSLLKVKVFDDEEFEIVGVNEGKGKLSGKAATFVCVKDKTGPILEEEIKVFLFNGTQPKNGKLFKAKLKGSIDNLKEYLVNFNKYKGKQLTVQFQGLTPDGIPRFPVGIRIREEE